MTVKQKNELTYSARVHSAEENDNHQPTKHSYGRAVFCFGGIAAVLLFTFAPDFTDKAADTVSEGVTFLSALSAKTEVSSPLRVINDVMAMAREMSENQESADYTDTPFVTDKLTADSLTLIGDDTAMLSYGSRRMPSSENEELIVEDIPVLPPHDEDTPLPYPDDISGQDGQIIPLTYEKGSGLNYIDLPMGGQIRNVTTVSSEEIYAAAVQPPDFKIELNAAADKPQVLIMHTHTTESYEPYSRSYFDEDFLCRTTDSSMNMTAVGRAMKKVFEDNGIRTLHDETIHDYPSYNGSYDRSRETVKAILEKYPSIKVVLDVHRDAIERENGGRVAPSTVINGKSSAQVMLICGCDDGTMGMPECMKNLSAASLFQQYMESSYSGLTRPVLFDYRQYNQDLTTGSLLLEVGGHANSIDQAVYAGELSAEAISQALTEISAEE